MPNTPPKHASEQQNAPQSRLVRIADGAAAVVIGLTIFLILLLLALGPHETQENTPCRQKNTNLHLV